MLALCTGLTLLFLAGVLYLRSGDLADPSVLQSVEWAVVFFSVVLFSARVNTISASTQLLVLTCVVMFASGVIIGSGDISDAERGQMHNGPPATGCWLLLAVVGAGFPFFLRRALELAALGPTSNMLVNVRFVVSGDELTLTPAMATFGPLGYLTSASAVALAGGLVPQQWPRRQLYLVLAWIIALAYAILSTGRTYMFQLLMIALGAQLIGPRRRAGFALLGTIAIGAAGFILFGTLAQKISLDNSAFDSIIYYFLGSIAAFDQHVHQATDLAWGANTLRTLSAVARAIGFDVPVVQLVKEFRYVPFATNVYTVFRPYWDDFGVAGAIGAMLTFGLLHGAIYRRAIRGSGPYVLMYMLAMYPLLMQVFQDQYFGLLSQWLQFAFLSALLYAPRILAKPVRHGGDR